MTVQLLSHGQNFAAITPLEFEWEVNQISIEFELWWKSC